MSQNLISLGLIDADWGDIDAALGSDVMNAALEGDALLKMMGKGSSLSPWRPRLRL